VNFCLVSKLRIDTRVQFTIYTLMFRCLSYRHCTVSFHASNEDPLDFKQPVALRFPLVCIGANPQYDIISRHHVIKVQVVEAVNVPECACDSTETFLLEYSGTSNATLAVLELVPSDGVKEVVEGRLYMDVQMYLLCDGRERSKVRANILPGESLCKHHLHY
jgi:hypothetical protein